MNCALILAGGSGQRMMQEIPKQFINVNDKPIIIYTLEAFQSHPGIDDIFVVCIDGWHNLLWSYAKQYNITKLKDIVSGGVTGQASIKCGLDRIKKDYSNDDIVMIHDGIRPMISAEIISENLAKCVKYGNAIAVVPCLEAMLYSENKSSSSQIISRDNLIRTQTPQSFHLGEILDAHAIAAKKGITNSVASCTIMIETGKEVFFSAGSEKNLKLTTPDDLDIFRALLAKEK